MRRARLGAQSFLLLSLLAAVLLGCQRTFEDRNRLVAERFARALEAGSTTQALALLAHDASAYLPGAKLHLPRAGYEAHLDNMHQADRGYHVVSRAFLTPGGAGFLVARKQPAEREKPGIERAELWMELAIDADGIRRVWLHYLPNDLATVRADATTYLREAELRQMPVPTGWSEGAHSIVAAAERADPYTPMPLPLADAADTVTLPAAALGGVIVLGTLRWRQRPQAPARPHHGTLIARLREARSRPPT